MKLPKVRSTITLQKTRAYYGSQKDFVEVLKIYDKTITLPAYAKWEKGNRAIPIEKATLIAACLNKNLYKMFSIDHTGELDKEEKRLLKY